MLNSLVHFREVPVNRVDCVECVDNAEFTGILQGSRSEPCGLCRVCRQC